MFTISKQILDNLGVELSDAESEKLLDHLQTTLENRIGEEVINMLDDKQLDEYMQLQETSNHEVQFNWLKTALPDLDEIVEDEYNILVGELAENYQQFMK